MSSNTAAPATIQIQGRSLSLANVLGAEAKPAEHPLRNGFFLITGLLCPILAMILFTQLEGPTMWAAGLATAVAPFLGLAISLVWKKPWGVVVEMSDRYRTVAFTSQAEAERLAAMIRAALG